MPIRSVGEKIANAVQKARQYALDIEGGIAFQDKTIALYSQSTSGETSLGSFTNHWAIRAKQANKVIDVPHYEIELDSSTLTDANARLTALIKVSDGRTFIIKHRRSPLSEYDTFKFYGVIQKT